MATFLPCHLGSIKANPVTLGPACRLAAEKSRFEARALPACPA
jgi:hypothetical protein